MKSHARVPQGWNMTKYMHVEVRTVWDARFWCGRQAADVIYNCAHKFSQIWECEAVPQREKQKRGQFCARDISMSTVHVQVPEK